MNRTESLAPLTITFRCPTFFADADEDRFFGWLYSMPEYAIVRGEGTALALQLTQPVSAETVRQLLVVFRRWCIDPESLLPLRRAETEHFVLWDIALHEASSDA